MIRSQFKLSKALQIDVPAIWGAAPEQDPTFQKKQLENLQQCHRERQDLKMMLHSATQGEFRTYLEKK